MATWNEIINAIHNTQGERLKSHKYLTTRHDEAKDAVYLCIAKDKDEKEIEYLSLVESVVNTASGVKITFKPAPDTTKGVTAFFPYSHVLDRIPDSSK